MALSDGDFTGNFLTHDEYIALCDEALDQYLANVEAAEFYTSHSEEVEDEAHCTMRHTMHDLWDRRNMRPRVVSAQIIA